MPGVSVRKHATNPVQICTVCMICTVCTVCTVCMICTVRTYVCTV